jgi:hypothetical protein
MRLVCGVLLACVMVVDGTSPLQADTGDKELVRVAGSVGYQKDATGAYRPVFGNIVLPDAAYVVTRPKSRGILRLRDSSEIEIGEGTSINVGAFNAAGSGKDNIIVLNNGALKFNIKRPAGGQSNYQFQTPTSQIAIRGTIGIITQFGNVTNVVCLSCSVGDVTATFGSTTATVVTGNTLTITASNGSFASSVSTNAVGNTPGASQFSSSGSASSGSSASSGASSGATSGSGASSSTGSAGSAGASGASSAGTGSAGTAASAGAGSAAGTVAGVAAGVAGTTAVVVAATNTTGSSSPAPTATPTPGSGVLSLVAGSAQNPVVTAFPQSFTFGLSEPGYTGNIALSASPASVVTLAQKTLALAGPAFSAVVTGTFVGGGTATVTAVDGNGQQASLTYTVLGPLAASPTVVSITAPGSGSVTLTQPPTGTNIAVTLDCSNSAGAANYATGGQAPTYTPGSGASPLVVTITANAAPNYNGAAPPAGAACQLRATGSGSGSTGTTVTVPVNITGVAATVQSLRRERTEIPGRRQPAPTPKP